ncbi:MAG: multifunctional oxoglutarate decarboxylase/oxoglutarate dehydrogenase thiamine pyrophosphate-binding subunit/dihydrolipoyllysine-residue succinyltransferase subunit [Holophagaceae bacterium]|nr:multifunctional oxoglutarate decarboxylase/oxoglutarate dehydrogenase thiamine pyrophosphate-binding subunit/dihydrolipoyllysine-residue succinyltransferase subunit [Holophagaceae bacterium]
METFGSNAGYAYELFTQYQRAPDSVEGSWRRIFETLENRPPESSLTLPPASTSTPTQSGIVQSSLLQVLGSELRPGEESVPITGSAATLVRNMEASLGIPTATSNRVIPVNVMEENRRILNHHREVMGLRKISFTHIVAWAVVWALEKHPGMNDAFGEIEGRPMRIKKHSVNLGIAVDVFRKDGSRSLLVPNIKEAESFDFSTFVSIFDSLVEKARKGSIEPEAFLGTSITLTNPGTMGTTASGPRLMRGQGSIIAIGAMGHPAEFTAMPAATLSELGVAHVMNISSTYDHRIIQGAVSGAFLSTLQDLLLGADSFYERIFADLKVPHRPMSWEKDTSPPPFGAQRGSAIEKQARILALINFYRVRGHLVANLDPLESGEVQYHSELDPATFGYTLWDLDRKFITNGLGGSEEATLREIVEVLRQTYCGKIGAEFMHIQDPQQKHWLMERMESTRNRADLTTEDRRHILAKLIEAEAFEKFLHTKYVGHKRFSLEGGEAAIPLLDRLLDRAAGYGIHEAVLGMSHRGRLTVLVCTVGKPVSKIFAEFEDVVDAGSIQGSGDVKYHLGATGLHHAQGGQTLRLTLAPNPSHLEAVDPVVEGMVRAKQRWVGDASKEPVLPVLLHGDAAFAGQGVVAETLNMSQLHGYRTGGTVHVVVNNQIGFTADPGDTRSSPYCTDIAKGIQAPIFHVNGDDPDAIAQVVDLAIEYQQHFHRDVVIDMVCYRRYGHNEGDEPSYTQPLLYQKIKEHPSVAHVYGDQLLRDGLLTLSDINALWAAAKEKLENAYEPSTTAGIESTNRPAEDPPPGRVAASDPGQEVKRERLSAIVRAVSTVPEGFEIHSKLLPLLKRRATYADGHPNIDWAGAEMLAIGMCLLEGIPVRLSGQDSGRGTFSQRHAVLADHLTGQELVPLNTIAQGQAAFEVIDSLLSENAVMGFEFGYSVADPSTLVLWEAQFGDFANGAQVVIDQFLSGSEQKWNQTSGLVLLLPHGQEGQGPEHSSARLERFLTLCAEENLRVANPTTPAQYYHLLRRQARDEMRKPLIVMAPKSLLRHPSAISSLDDLIHGSFSEVLDDETFADATKRDTVRRIIVASGKVVYDLLAARATHKADDVAILRLEQLYPFPGAKLGQTLATYPQDAELVFVQEEPRNMGAWRFVREQFLDGRIVGLGPSRSLSYLGRRELASPAPGSNRMFKQEQEALVAEALGKGFLTGEKV